MYIHMYAHFYFTRSIQCCLKCASLAANYLRHIGKNYNNINNGTTTQKALILHFKSNYFCALHLSPRATLQHTIDTIKKTYKCRSKQLCMP